MHCLTEGSLLDSEYSARDQVEAGERLEHLQKLRADRRRLASKKVKHCNPSRVPLPQGSTVFVDASVKVDLTKSFAAMGLHIERSAIKSIIIVAQNPGVLPPAIEWTATLNGALVVDPDYVLSCSAAGTCLVYKAAIVAGGTHAKPRHFWCSMRFKQLHADLYQVLTQSARSEVSVWQEVDRAALAHAVAVNTAGPVRQHRNMAAIAIVAGTEGILYTSVKSVSSK